MTGGGRQLPIIGGGLPGSAPGFQRIAIVGLGAVGGSLALALRRAWPDALVIGVDTHAVIEAAIRMHAIDVGSDDLMIAADADLVVLAGGADENARVLPYLADAIAGEAIVLALGDDGAIADLARALPGRLPLVRGVPALELRGSGLHAASADLFRGRHWTVTPVTGGDEAAVRAHRLIRAIGAEPVAGAVHTSGLPAGEKSSV